MTGYRVAISGDQAAPDGTTIFGDIGLRRLAEAGLGWTVIPAAQGGTYAAAELRGFDALLMMGGLGIDESSFDDDGTLHHVARFGAGYDAIDVEACTRHGVLLTNTATAVRQPMAHAAVAFVFALAHNLVVKDRLVRTGRWNDRTRWQGRGLDGATIGIVGLGGIGAATAQAFRALGLRVVAYNRSDRSSIAAELGVTMLPLVEVAAASDFLIVTVSATAETRSLIDEDVIAALGPNGYLVNIARGSVVDEAALIAALEKGSVRGAALDVFRQEPVDASHPLLTMENVVLTPHSLCWTDGFARAVADSALTAIIDVAAGRMPASPVNPQALSIGAVRA